MILVGKFPNEQEVAIKRLAWTSGQGRVEFQNEAKLIAKLQYTNLVKLLGCSIHGEERLLVYEFMPNKSLDSSFSWLYVSGVYHEWHCLNQN